MRLLRSTLLLLTFASAPATAATYYMDDTGNDANPGTSALPFRTFGRANTAAGPGDTILVKPGTYNADPRTTKSGTSIARLIWKSEVKWAAKIRGAGQGTVWDNTGSYVTIVGFDIAGTEAREGIYNDGSHVTIDQNYVHDILAPSCTSNGGAGINSAGPDYTAVDVTFTRNLVKRIGPPPPGACSGVQGIYMAHDQGKIINNIVCGAWYGIHLWHAPSNIDIVNNLSFANYRGGMVIGAGDSPGGVVTHGIRAINNIIVDNDVLGITETGETGPNIAFYNNLVWGNPTNWSIENGRVNQSPMNLAPQFVNYLANCNGDYHLQAGSPAIGSGSNLAPPKYDFDGTTRPIGIIDRGPYER
jgi:hypothetical protein